jgi:Kef-type K+ transport system membrane component KefB
MLVEGFVSKDNNPLLLIVIVIILILVYIFNRYFKIERFKKISGGIIHFSVRLIFSILLGLIILCSISGVEFILGAFFTGMVIKSAQPTKDTVHKLEIIGFGLFVPIFYILVGVKIGLHTPIYKIFEWESLFLIILLFIILIIIKIPFMYLLKWFKISTVIQTTIFVACTLISSITIHEFGVFDEEFIDALIVASCLTCIIPPVIFNITKNYGRGKNENDTRIINPN